MMIGTELSKYFCTFMRKKVDSFRLGGKRGNNLPKAKITNHRFLASDIVY